MRKVFLIEEDNQIFLEKGFVKKQLLSGPELEYLSKALPELTPNDKFDPTVNPTNDFNLSSYHCTFLDDNITYKRAVDDLIRNVFSGLIHQHLDNYSILTSNFYVKPPGKGLFQIHQNWPTLQNLDLTTVTIWVPLHDTDASNGTLHVVEGSHKMVGDIAAVGAVPYFSNIEDLLIAEYLKPIPLKAGECLIFCDSLIHWSPQNNSDQPRIAIQIEAIPTEEQAVLYYFNPERPEVFEVFEVNSSFFIENSIEAVINRPTGLKSLGTIKNNNRILDHAEFKEKLTAGSEKKKKLLRSKTKSSLFERAKLFLSRKF
jgi:hypothetical protein